MLETLPNQPRPYSPHDKPEFGEDRGPSCLHLPNPPWSQSSPVTRQPNFDDGIDEPTGKGTSRARRPATQPWTRASSGSRATPAAPRRPRCIADLLAPGLGTTADDVSDLGALLLGPMVRGATVSYVELGGCLDEAPRQEDQPATSPSSSSSSSSPRSPPACSCDDRQHLVRPNKTYKAEFVDATGVVKGDDIRIAGVKVGTVDEVEISNRTRALVTFTVDETTPMTEATNATIKYRNLVGQRYISLTQEIGLGRRARRGRHDPGRRTSPALDLTVLFNGFKPLFQALSPADINQLSYEIVQVFQGEGGTLESLLGHTASVTNTLAERDEVISGLIDNLNVVLDHLGDRDEQLSELILNFKTFVGGLKDDRDAILDSLDQISVLSVRDGLPGQGHPLAVRRGHQAAAPAHREHRAQQGASWTGPSRCCRSSSTKVGRTAIYGSFFNFYLCNFQGKVRLPGQPHRAGELRHRLRRGVISDEQAVPRAQPGDHRGDQHRRDPRCMHPGRVPAPRTCR